MATPTTYTISIPGLAADDYDGGEVGQGAMFGRHLNPACPDRALVQAWAEARVVRAGKGTRRLVTLTSLADVASLHSAFDALWYGARDNDEPALARALADASRRCAAVLHQA